MVCLIQNSEVRDPAAMQAKLDELLRAGVEAREDCIGSEHLTDRGIEVIREKLEADCAGIAEVRPRQVSLGRVLRRF
jgi:low affinity Fe/Cu permease